MNKNNARNHKRQRLGDAEGGKADRPSEIGVILSKELRGLLGGRKYVKARDRRSCWNMPKYKVP